MEESTFGPQLYFSCICLVQGRDRSSKGTCTWFNYLLTRLDPLGDCMHVLLRVGKLIFLSLQLSLRVFLPSNLIHKLYMVPKTGNATPI